MAVTRHGFRGALAAHITNNSYGLYMREKLISSICPAFNTHSKDGLACKAGRSDFNQVYDHPRAVFLEQQQAGVSPT